MLAGIVFAACVALAAGSAPRPSHVDGLKQHRLHLDYLTRFPCWSPQPRVIFHSELFKPGPDRIYDPEATVLHRCDYQAGCCPQGDTCQPGHSQEVDLIFKVTYMEDHDGHLKGSWAMEHYMVLNHTKCACKLDER